MCIDTNYFIQNDNNNKKIKLATSYIKAVLYNKMIIAGI